MKTCNGKILSLLVQGSDTVSNAKAQIQEKELIGLDKYQLIFAGKPLESGRTLAEYNVRPQSSLELVPRVRGGMRLKITDKFGKKITLDVKASDTEFKLSGQFSNQKTDNLECSCQLRLSLIPLSASSPSLDPLLKTHPNPNPVSIAPTHPRHFVV